MSKTNKKIPQLIKVNLILSKWSGEVVYYINTVLPQLSLFSLIDHYDMHRCLIVLENINILVGIQKLEQQTIVVMENERIAYLVSSARYFLPNYEFTLWVIARSQQQLFYVQERIT